MNEVPQVPAGVDTGRPTPARIYDYMLQGNNYFQGLLMTGVMMFVSDTSDPWALVSRYVASIAPGSYLSLPYEGAEPGVTFTGLWGAEDVTMADSDGSRWLYCGVARKP